MTYLSKHTKKTDASNSIIIQEDRVVLNTNFNYKAIEIHYSGDLFIDSLLPSDYAIMKQNNKLLILQVNTRDENLSDLFLYNGKCTIRKATLHNLGDSQELYINTESYVNWNNLSYRTDIDGNTTTQAWENMTTYWEDLSFTGRNDYVDKKVYKPINKDTITTSGTGFGTRVVDKQQEEFEIQKVPSRVNKRDKNIFVVGDLYTKGSRFKIKGSDEPYQGDYHCNTKTGRILTGKNFTTDSKQLVPIERKD